MVPRVREPGRPDLDARCGWWHLEPADVLTPRTPSWDDWHLGYGVDLRPDGVWGKDGGDPGVLVIARYRPATDTTAVFLANVDDDGVEDLDTLAFNLVNTRPRHLIPLGSHLGALWVSERNSHIDGSPAATSRSNPMSRPQSSHAPKPSSSKSASARWSASTSWRA